MILPRQKDETLNIYLKPAFSLIFALANVYLSAYCVWAAVGAEFVCFNSKFLLWEKKKRMSNLLFNFMLRWCIYLNANCS